ncbi:MAG: HlyD family efflux transporter periplasmic adaptor subunit [Gammaproteobacteria bacterium]|nr:HlyD family efflux transporter periplasmic adaptor subunit [Gammaproteobacteria bacterium]MDE2346089.1 HlyD family efflux transporter periplasmic adaptor subunit [Gammaproteobacteria bacterium]
MPDIAIAPEIRRRRKHKRYIAIGVSVAVVIGLVIWALTRAPAGPSVQRSDLWIATVQQGPLPIVVSATGTFTPVVERWITAATPGVVETVRVQPGDPVKPDTVLATLSNPAAVSSLVQARADVANAEATRASLRAQLTNQLLDLQARLASAQVQAKTAALKEQAERSLLAQHIVSTLDYATIQLQAQEYAKLVTLTQQRVAAFRQSMAAQDQAADAQVAALKAALSDRQQQVDALHVTANLEGVVQDVAAQTGQTLALGGNIARVASLKQLKVTLQVPANQVGEVAVGQSVTLELATNSTQDLNGKVIRVSPAVANGNVEVDVMPEGPLPSDTRPNLAVTGQIHIANIANTIYVQRPAYANPDSSMTLYRLADDGSTAMPVSVRFGAASDRYIQVMSGLTPNEQVIVSDTSGFAGAKQVSVR